MDSRIMADVNEIIIDLTAGASILVEGMPFDKLPALGWLIDRWALVMREDGKHVLSHGRVVQLVFEGELALSAPAADHFCTRAPQTDVRVQTMFGVTTQVQEAAVLVRAGEITGSVNRTLH